MPLMHAYVSLVRLAGALWIVVPSDTQSAESGQGSGNPQITAPRPEVLGTSILGLYPVIPFDLGPTTYVFPEYRNSAPSSMCANCRLDLSSDYASQTLNSRPYLLYTVPHSR